MIIDPEANSFGDFEDDDALDDFPDLTEDQWSEVAVLQEKYEAIQKIEDRVERKNAAKALIREVNGEE